MKCSHRFWNRIPDTERERVVEHALEHPALSCREVAASISDEKGYFVPESRVYRLLKAAGLVVPVVYPLDSHGRLLTQDPILEIVLKA